MLEKTESPDSLFKSLVGAKDVTVNVITDTMKYAGVMQGVSINIAQTVDRLITIGSKATLPFAGYYMAQVTARRLMLHSLPNNDDLADGLNYKNLQFNSLPNPVEYIILTIKTPENWLEISMKNAYWNAHSISVQAGQVLVFEDISFECEDVEIFGNYQA
ncbi:MAG: hypothetical protein QXE80_03260 [Pyrobaculum sp.]